MKKNWLILLLLLATSFSYADVVWNGEEGRISIIYKIVDPLLVEVETPKRLIVSATQKEFTYSKMTETKQPLLVTVKSPYNTVDEILRKIYENVYLELQDNGVYTLRNDTTTKVITGKGYFIDAEGNATTETKTTYLVKQFANRVSGTGFSVTTNIDSDFVLPEGEVPMGVYKGTLRLNVWFGGSLN